jgi:3-phenylpropionate/trans-cinnamate dioxygenase ferredoxin subunit
MSGNRPEASGSFARVLKTSDVPPGTKKAVEICGQSILVCHSQDRFYAISNICSHAHEKLECGRMLKGWIACPAHGARFDLATGRAMNPPAVRGIRTFEIRIVDDWIEVRAEAEGEDTCLQGMGCAPR